jgi:sugar phosphate isomerase/epimerase
LERAKEFYKKIQDIVDPEEQWKLKQQARALSQFVTPETEFPTILIDKEISELKRRISQYQEASSSQWAQAEEAMETIRNVESAETYALREAYDAYAAAAMTAMKHTEKLQKEGKLKKPIAVALENLFPETYGSHPDELIKLVHNSRSRFMEILKNEKGYSENAAKEAAERHITATFDTGHLNMWRKYWVPDEKKSMKENDEDFNKWMLNKVGEMVDKNIMGHVHIDDNQGYQDEHLAPGEGNTPIKEMVDLLKKKGYKGELIIEPGADYYTDVSGFHSVMKGWSYFGSPVYGRGSGLSSQKRNWKQVGYGYFGQTESPYFTFGAYSPSEDWTLWSGVPME